MNVNARNALCDMVRQYGRSVIDDPGRCKSLLHDFISNDRPELTILLGALSEGIPADLVTSQGGMPPLARISRLSGKLQQNLLLAEDAAHWAVESWALALGIVSGEALRRQPTNLAAVEKPQDREHNDPGIRDVPTTGASVGAASNTQSLKEQLDASPQQQAAESGDGAIKAIALVVAIVIGIFIVRALMTSSDSNSRSPIRAPGQDWAPYEPDK